MKVKPVKTIQLSFADNEANKINEEVKNNAICVFCGKNARVDDCRLLENTTTIGGVIYKTCVCNDCCKTFWSYKK